MTAPARLDFADIDELVTQLSSADGIRSVDVDPAKINLPGIWVRFDGIDLDRLDGADLRMTLALITGYTDVRRAMATLGPLFNTVVDVLDTALGIGPDEAGTAAGTVQMPDGSAPKPALLIPITLATQTTEETP